MAYLASWNNMEVDTETKVVVKITQKIGTTFSQQA